MHLSKSSDYIHALTHFVFQAASLWVAQNNHLTLLGSESLILYLVLLRNYNTNTCRNCDWTDEL